MVTIRKATTEDLARLEELYRELEEDAVLYQPEHFVFSPKGTRTEQVKEILDSDTQTMLVAEKGADFFRTQVFPQNTDGLRFYERNGFSEKMITIECPF